MGKMERRKPDSSMDQRAGNRGFHAARRERLLGALPVCTAMLLALLPAFHCAAQSGVSSPQINPVPHLMGLELNAEIARANGGFLTASQLRRVAEIEKLAHNVREKMSTSVRWTPAFQAPFQPVRY
jgi:hypothetical protein